jgi:predicted transcriptional regulator
MEKTITIRLDAEQNEALTRRAKTVGKTRSALVREILARALSEQTIAERAGHLKGAVPLRKPKSGWGKHLKEQNWR